MPVSLDMDVHVPYPITEQLRLRGIDVLTAQEDGYRESTDEQLLARATSLGRVIFTQDILFRVLAEYYQRNHREFGGLIFGSQYGGTIGKYVGDLELVAKLSELHEWRNVVEFLPFPQQGQ